MVQHQHRKPRQIRGAEPPFPAARVYSFTVFARVKDAVGMVDGVQERRAYVAHTSPEGAIAEAQRILAIEPRAGRVIEWLIGSADENGPEAAAEWARWHAATDAREDAPEGAERAGNTERDESPAPAAAEA